MIAINDGLTATQRYRARHRAVGLCVHCSRTSAPGHADCEVCLQRGRESRPAQRRATAASRRATGRCMTCGSKRRYRFAQCRRCYEGHAVAHARWLRKRRGSTRTQRCSRCHLAGHTALSCRWLSRATRVKIDAMVSGV